MLVRVDVGFSSGFLHRIQERRKRNQDRISKRNNPKGSYSLSVSVEQWPSPVARFEYQ